MVRPNDNDNKVVETVGWWKKEQKMSTLENDGLSECVCVCRTAMLVHDGAAR